MPERFFIFALPRSRTAWLANWFTQTTGNVSSFCMHDGFRTPDLPCPLNYDYVGNSDSSNILHAVTLEKRWPEARYLVVRRDVDDVVKAAIASLQFLEPDTSAIKDRVRRLDQMQDALLARRRPEVMAIGYEELSEEGVLEYVQQWLTPRLPWNHDRWLLLSQMKMVIDSTTYEVPV